MNMNTGEKSKRKVPPSQRRWAIHIIYLGIILALVAVNVLKSAPPPVTPTASPPFVSVDAEKGWQSSGVTIPAGAQVEMTVMDGKWTNWKDTAPYNSGYGTGYICAKAMNPAECVEPLPSASSDALIGRIGSQVFLIGGGTVITAEQSATLEMRINDVDTALYDNDGKLTVQIHVR